jgi:peptide/nickel transport system substrate-binding protein
MEPRGGNHVTRRRLAAILAGAVLGLLAVLAAGCGGGGDEEAGGEETTAETTADTGAAGGEETTEGEEGAAQAGGVFRVEWETSFDFTGGFDPTGEYLGEAIGIMNNLLVRTLVQYPHIEGTPGNELLPDLATDLGQVSEDGLTWTFTLKDGIKFGPPLSREITSQDIVFAFERIGTESVVAQYGFYFDVIEGMTEFKAGEADTISGIAAPDDKTITFTLTEAVGDFLYRLALPAAGPMPEEVAGCFTEANVYGGYLVSSGPYMIEGSDAQDATSCDTLQPLSGFDPNTRLSVVRNPDYDPATDTPEARENFPDQFTWTINTNVDDIFNKIAAGEAETAIAGEPPKVLREYTTNEDLQQYLHAPSGDRTWYITLNMTQPPFDDIHVRKAANLVMDKEGLRRAWGGSVAGEISTHIVPDPILNDVLVDYDPYPSADFAGDEAAAKEEMKQSKYDTDGDGICDAPECKDVLYLTATDRLRQDMIPPTQASLEKIGITLKVRSVDDAYTPIQTVRQNIAISGRPGWGKDYADASTFFVLFDGRNIIPEGNTNYSLAGATCEQLQAIDGWQGNCEGIPNVDADIDACSALPSGDERISCYADLDKKIMEEVVPWVPYLEAFATYITNENVTKWDFDQGVGSPAYAHVAVAQ